MLKKISAMALLALAILITPISAEAKNKIPVTVSKKAVLAVKSNKKIKWKSSKKKVVTVKKIGKKKAKLIAKKKGRAKVTITAGKKKYTCKILVKAIKGKKANLAVTVGSKKYVCKAAVQKSTPAVVTPTPTKPGNQENTDKQDPTSEKTDPTPDNQEKPDTTPVNPTKPEPTPGGEVEDYVDFNSMLVAGYFEDLDGKTLRKYRGIAFPDYPEMRDVTVELINNVDEEGNIVFFTTFYRKNLDDAGELLLNSTQCAAIGFQALRVGEADAVITNGEESITVHLVADDGYEDIAKYAEWIRAMVTTDLGTEKIINVYGEDIHVDGVKGKDDVETMVNLGAWVAAHKIHDDGEGEYPYDSGYYIFEDDFLGAECGGLNYILVDGATLLGHTAWEYVDSSGGHLPMKWIDDDGWIWKCDVGGSGKSLPRGVTVLGLNEECTIARDYVFNPPHTDIWNHEEWAEWDAYYDIDANGNMTKRQ